MGPLFSHVAILVIYEMPKVRNVLDLRSGVTAYKRKGDQPKASVQNL